MNVKGLKISDILNIDLETFNKLNEKELRALTSRLVSAGNKRIRRLQQHEPQQFHCRKDQLCSIGECNRRACD